MSIRNDHEVAEILKLLDSIIQKFMMVDDYRNKNGYIPDGLEQRVRELKQQMIDLYNRYLDCPFSSMSFAVECYLKCCYEYLYTFGEEVA